MSWDLVKSCTVEVTNSTGNVCGTGFFVSPAGHLMTCAHVVDAAGGWQQVRVNGQPVTQVHLGDHTRDDLAILQVAGYKGQATPLSTAFQPMDRFLSIGYGRPDFPQGASIDGAITDVNPQSDFGNLPMLRLRTQANSQQVQGGYSGSPVYDAENRCVVGLIAAYDNTEGALAIPMTTVLEKWPDLGAFLQSRHTITAAGQPATGKSKVFISYRSQDPDLSLAQQFYEGLKSAGYEPFMAGQSIRWGEDWPKRIDAELEQCNYFLLLLSPSSATSDMVTEEVRRAKQLHDSRPDDRPIILPIRVNFSSNAPINYDLGGYLSRIQQKKWESPADTQKLLQEMLSLLAKMPDSSMILEEDETPEQSSFRNIDDPRRPPLPMAAPELPEGQVPLASTFYVERYSAVYGNQSPLPYTPTIEHECKEKIANSSALIRIKAPRQMGKTSLMARILHHAGEQGCRTVPLTFQLASSKVFMDLDKFLLWLCANVGRRLGLSTKPSDIWDEKTYDCMDNCSIYFEYVLNEISEPLALGLDEVDLVFQHPENASDFFSLLRGWHDQKDNELWQKLRLVIAHSTEVYVPLDINRSPFNVGFSVGLPEFNAMQIHDLARRHSLSWRDAEVKSLMAMVGGHPFLVRVALYAIARSQTTLPQLLATAPTEAGLFSDHLRRHWWNLEHYPELKAAIKQVVSSNSAVGLDSEEAFKLESMGLVHRQDNDVVPRCELYRSYFRDRLGIR